MGHPPAVPAARDLFARETHPQSSECSSRQPVDKASDHRDRMVPTPQHSVPDVLQFGLLAIQKAVIHFLPLIRGNVVVFPLDNSSTVAYLHNQGGMHSLPMFYLSWDIPPLCQQHGISLPVRHIPSHLNVLADSLSIRLQIIGTEWFLHPSIVCQMFSIWYIPELDLFLQLTTIASCPPFCLQFPDPRAVAVDAPSIPRDRQWGYAYPPAALM